MFGWSLGLGAFVGGALSVGFGAAPLIPAALLLALAWCVGRTFARVALAAAIALIGFAWGDAGPGPWANLGTSEAPVRISGRLAAPPDETSSGRRLHLSPALVDGAPVPELTLWTERIAAAPPLGAQIHVAARFQIRGPKNPGFTWATVPSQRHAAAIAPRGSLLHWTPAPVPWPLRIRAHLRAALTLPGAEATAVYRALLLGERRGIHPNLRATFADSGTAHLLAISGLHVSVVGWGIFRLALMALLLWPRMAQIGRPRAWSAAIALSAVFAWVALIHPSHATWRAVVIASLVFGAIIARRTPKPWRLLGLAALAVVLADPRAPWGASFQLSFAAAGSIVAVLPLLRAIRRAPILEGVEPKVLRIVALALAQSAVVSTVTWLATAPLALAWFGQVAPAGLWLNIVAVPWVSLVVVPIGMLWWGLAALWSDAASALSDVPGAALAPLLDLLEAAIDPLGPAHAAAPDQWVGVLASLAIVLLFGRRFAWGAAAAMIAILALTLLGPPSGSLRLTMLDIGHGDALVLQLPGGANALIDTGGARFGDGFERHARDRRLADRTLAPALSRLGIGRLDLLVLTHADADHIGGALRLVQRVPVRALWVPPCATRHPHIRAIARRVLATGGTVRVIERAPTLHWSGAEIEVLAPDPAASWVGRNCSKSLNDRGIALRVKAHGRSLILAADLEVEGERRLVAAHGKTLRADLLKVGHHGSQTSSTDAFLDAVSPQWALVSGRLQKGRMPPHPDILRRLQSREIRTLRTGLGGAISLVIRPDGGFEFTRGAR